MRTSKRNLNKLILIVFLLIFFGGVRLYHISGLGLSYDELQSVTFSYLPFKSLLQAVETFDPHPPIYYLQLHIWMLFGLSDAWIRLNSFFWSSLTLISIFIICKSFFNDKTALFSTILYIFSPTAVFYAQDARMYAMLMCLGVWIWGLTTLFLHEKKMVSSGIGIFLFTLAFLYSHGAAFIILFCTFSYALLSWVFRQTQIKTITKWIAIQIGCVILYIPFLIRADHISVGHTMAPNFAQFRDTFSILFFGLFTPPPIFLSWFAIIALLIIILMMVIPRNNFPYFISYILVPIFACLLISYIIRPIWHYRTIAFLIPFFCISGALILNDINFRWNRITVNSKFLQNALLFLVSCGLIICIFYQQSKPRKVLISRNAIQFVENLANSNDMIVFNNPRVFWGWCWYALGAGSINPLVNKYNVISKTGKITLVSQDPILLVSDNIKIFYVRRDLESPLIIPTGTNLMRKTIYNSYHLIIEEIYNYPKSE